MKQAAAAGALAIVLWSSTVRFATALPDGVRWFVYMGLLLRTPASPYLWLAALLIIAGAAISQRSSG
jgi:hypothetical protein